MNPTLARAIALASLLSPAAVHALGLGDIRLNSALNQPFDAEIELVSATAEDLAALRAALASNETFDRYGLDKPAFLSDFQFRVTRGSNGRDVLRVTSPAPVTEPFVTLLVEANWPRGRLLREYTVLLDPPTFASPEPAAASAAPPVAVSAPVSTAAVAPPPARPAPAAAAEPAAAAPAPVERPRATAPVDDSPRSLAGSYRVQPNDTLWRIASRIDGGSQADVNQAMLAIYRGNPDAFDGNINLIRSGALLRLPEAGEVTAMSADAAAVEVARQYRLWQDGQSASAAVAPTGRLRLVAPEQGGTDASTRTTASPVATRAAGDAVLEARVRELESQLAETRRLLELQSAELANLQGRATGEPVEAAQEPVAQAPTGASPLEAELVEPLPETGTDEVPVADVETAPDAAAAAAASAATEAADEASPERKKKAAVPAPAAEPTLLERLDPFKWPLLGGLLVLLLGGWAWQRRRAAAESADESLEESFSEHRARRSFRKSSQEQEDFTTSDILVEERDAIEPVAPVATAAAALATARSAAGVSPSPTAAAGAAGADDSLAEADFHMAYGLYDQAADLVKSALEREPGRRDLQLKLLEVYFVSGNRERFLELARRMRSAGAGGDWDKIGIMGRQIAPDDALFADAPSGTGGGLDLDLEFTGTTLDVDRAVADEAAASTPDHVLGDSPATADATESGLDFVLDEPGRGADVDSGSLSPTVEMPRPTATTVEVPRPGAVAPTVELPIARANSERTDEMSIDRLGLDVGTTAALQSLDHDLSEDFAEADDSSLDSTAEHEAIRRGNGDARPQPLEESMEDLLSTTAMLKAQTGTFGNLSEVMDGVDNDTTGERTALQEGLATAEVPRPRAASEETQLAGELTAYADVSFPLSSAEASTLSEVGTKLDLARAYIDMGDPEGARSILDEVVEEGDSSQQGEARRLIAALP